MYEEKMKYTIFFKWVFLLSSNTYTQLIKVNKLHHRIPGIHCPYECRSRSEKKIGELKEKQYMTVSEK